MDTTKNNNIEEVKLLFNKYGAKIFSIFDLIVVCLLIVILTIWLVFTKNIYVEEMTKYETNSVTSNIK